MPNQAVLRIGSLLVLGFLGCATLQSRSQTKKVDDLNEAALKDFQAGRSRDADQKLLQALEEAEKTKLGTHPVVAKTHMNRGVVLASGLKKRSRAVDAMVNALTIDPGATPPKALRDNRVDRAFALAQERVAAATPAAPAAEPEPPAAEPVVAEAAPAPVPAKKTKRAKKQKAEAEAKAEAEVKAEAKVDGQVAVGAEPIAPAVPAGPPPVEPPVNATVDASEAALPSPMPELVYCPLPDQVPPGQNIAVWCGVEPSLRAKAVKLYVRGRNKAEFDALPMTQSERGWWVATIDGSLVGTGGMLQFYVQAEAAGDKVVGSTADAYSPDILMIHPRARRVPVVMTQAYLDGEVDMEPEAELPVEDPLAKKRGFDWQRVWVGLQVGTGYGWHAASDLEFRQEIRVEADTASAGILHILPELAYQYSDRWAFSLQTRHQFLPNEGDTGGRTGRPAQGAHAALLRAIYTRPLASRFSILGSAAVGAGEGFRMVLDPVPNKGRSGTDSVVSGPVLVGAGFGGLFHLTQQFALSAELRALVGAPKFGVLGELNLGFRYAFGVTN